MHFLKERKYQIKFKIYTHHCVLVIKIFNINNIYILQK